MTSWC